MVSAALSKGFKALTGGAKNEQRVVPGGPEGGEESQESMVISQGEEPVVEKSKESDAMEIER